MAIPNIKELATKVRIIDRGLKEIQTADPDRSDIYGSPTVVKSPLRIDVQRRRTK